MALYSTARNSNVAHHKALINNNLISTVFVRVTGTADNVVNMRNCPESLVGTVAQNLSVENIA